MVGRPNKRQISRDTLMKLNINDNQWVEFIYWIFERELAPPFKREDTPEGFGGFYPYYNNNGEYVGKLTRNGDFVMENKLLREIKNKIFQAFNEINDNDRNSWIQQNWITYYPHFKTWIEKQINTNVRIIY